VFIACSKKLVVGFRGAGWGVVSQGSGLQWCTGAFAPLPGGLACCTDSSGGPCSVCREGSELGLRRAGAAIVCATHLDRCTFSNPLPHANPTLSVVRSTPAPCPPTHQAALHDALGERGAAAGYYRRNLDRLGAAGVHGQDNIDALLYLAEYCKVGGGGGGEGVVISLMGLCRTWPSTARWVMHGDGRLCVWSRQGAR
jgi:hypothetical protein